jgi:RsiW-degrading membrane proteinase PrsW (M82 family)
MPVPTIHQVFLALAALVSVAMWLDYFRRIDVFEKEKLVPLLFALLVGASTPYLCLLVYRVIHFTGFTENGNFINDLLYAIFAIGLNEELCKLAGVLVVFFLLRKQINEPIDFLIYAGVTALGFALVENYYYFLRHGIRIITSRTFYSALEHIINTTIVVYGIYRTHIFKKGTPVKNTLVALSIAVASHGLFDFFLTESFSGYFVVFFSLLIYLVGINFWIQMLNNANNYSTFFDYDKINHSRMLAWRLSYWYLLTLAIAFVNNIIAVDLQFSVITLLYNLVSDGFLFFMVILRVSRFNILREKYFKVSIGLPFYLTRNNDEDLRIPFINIPLKIRGETLREHLLTRYLHRNVYLVPLDPLNSFLGKETLVNITGKHLLKNDVVVYSIQLLENKSDQAVYYLQPRYIGIKGSHNNYPVEGLYKLEDLKSKEIIGYNDLKWLEWVYLKPV